MVHLWAFICLCPFAERTLTAKEDPLQKLLRNTIEPGNDFFFLLYSFGWTACIVFVFCNRSRIDIY